MNTKEQLINTEEQLTPIITYESSSNIILPYLHLNRFNQNNQINDLDDSNDSDDLESFDQLIQNNILTQTNRLERTITIRHNLNIPNLIRQTTLNDNSFISSFNKYKECNKSFISKINLVKNSLDSFLSTIQNIAPLCNITLITYNSDTEIFNGTITEIKTIINNLDTIGATNFIKMTNVVKQILLNINIEKYAFILTDGYHNEGGSIDTLLNDESINGIFNITLGIGNNYSVETDLLNHLSGNIEYANLITSKIIEIKNFIIGTCFEGILNLGMQKVEFEAIFESDQQIIVCDEKNREYFTDNELAIYLLKLNKDQTDKPIFNNIAKCYEIYNSYYIIAPNSNIKSNLESKYLDKQIHFVIAIDNSKSMSENIEIISNNQNSNQILKRKYINDNISDVISDTIQDILSDTLLDTYKHLTKISFKEMVNFTEISNFIFKGNLKYLIIKYNDINKIQKIELIPITYYIDNSVKKSVEKSNTVQIIIEYIEIINKLELINQIPKIINNFKEIKEKIKQLHQLHITFITNIEDKNIDEWLISQCRVLWEQVVIRYRATLNRGDEFIEFANVSPNILCRSISANISSSYSSNSSDTNIISDTNNLCKICYNNPVNMVFTDCRHAGTCTNCIITYINMHNNTINNYNCPFCKIKVNSYILLEEIKPICEIQSIKSTINLPCGSLVKYYGNCAHPISCNKCIKHLSHPTIINKYKCIHCTNKSTIEDIYVEVMKIFYV
jgi:hypothetical protein